MKHTYIINITFIHFLDFYLKRRLVQLETSAFSTHEYKTFVYHV